MAQQHTSQQTHPQGHEPAAQGVHTGHPTPATYFKVAMTLVIITAIEVAIFYATWLGHGIIPILVLLSAGKFALVVMFYMHLKYDHRLFSGMFVAGFFVAAGVIFALLALFRFFL
jgi:cytochrome c oxidase subunit 4